MTKRESCAGDVVKHYRQAEGAADFRLLLKEHNGDCVMIERIRNERIRPIEVVAADKVEVDLNSAKTHVVTNARTIVWKP